jgi:hypothetical protein
LLNLTGAAFWFRAVQCRCSGPGKLAWSFGIFMKVTMRITSSLVLTLICLGCGKEPTPSNPAVDAIAIISQDIEQPLKRTKVGDFAVFKGQGFQANTVMRQEVMAISGQDVSIRTTMFENGIEKSMDDRKFKIDHVFDPATNAKARGDTVVDAGKSQETLKVNGKEYECECRWYSVKFAAKDKEEIAETRIWISLSAPIYGKVKHETIVRGQVVDSMELTETGSTN